MTSMPSASRLSGLSIEQSYNPNPLKALHPRRNIAILLYCSYPQEGNENDHRSAGDFAPTSETQSA